MNLRFPSLSVGSSRSRSRPASRLIALEWDSCEARIVLATVNKGRLTIRDAEQFALPAGAGAEAELQKQFRAIIDRHRFNKADCLLAVGRSAVELKYLTLPPVPDDELPELVRFQSVKEFASVGEDWPIDYLPLDEDPTQPRHVMAGTLNPQFVGQFQATCAELQIALKSIVVRTCGMASLVSRQFPLSAEEGSLLVDPLDRQMDLAVLRGETMVYLRSARGDVADWNEESLYSATLEVRRTIAAASSRLGGKRLSTIYLCGSGPGYEQFSERLQTEFELPTHLFDPFHDLAIAGDLAIPQDERSRYAPLIGMLLDAADQKPHALDFLQPRQKPQPPDRRRQWIGLAAAAAVLVLMSVGWVWQQLHALDAEIEQLTTESRDLDVLVKRGQELDKKIVEIDKWATTDITWLDELATLAEKLPSAERLMLTQLRAAARTGGGEWQLDGVARDVDTISQIEQGLKDPAHDVEHRASQRRSSSGPYPWLFKSSVLINTAPEPDAAPAKPAPASPARRR